MAFSDVYRRQVELLVRTLPLIVREECFALKGGTAINLFVRDLPRLSVDIDLTYLPVKDRDQSLQEIDTALKNIAGRIKSADHTVDITESAPGLQRAINKLVVRTRDRIQIKVEVTPILRGCVYDPEIRPIVEEAEDLFGFAEISVLSFADLYAGKIMAALDRQHPRDLFDIHQLLTNEGMTEQLRNALIVYLISHGHSPHSMLSPTLRDITYDFTHNFVGMTEYEIPFGRLLDARTTLINDIRSNMPDNHKQFLLSFYQREPDWALLGIDGACNLPAVRWRELNLDKAGAGTREHIVGKLEALFSGSA